MFKKLKDKIAEEVKQSPLKSVQQLAQAVVSPNSSSVFEPSSSNDKFCIEEGDIKEEETSAGAKSGGFTSVTLTGQTSSPRRDSNLGFRPSPNLHTVHEAENFFPVFEPQPTNFHVQSEVESASEVEDRYSQLEHINKESLYEAYRKVYNRYNKMKNKYHELVTHYRLLEREKEKAKTVLTETQDKALLRISELREQCVLEQQAKAHLEEALRNELEERDHIINSLKTKVQYLKNSNEGGSREISEERELSRTEDENLIDFTDISLQTKVPSTNISLSHPDSCEENIKKCNYFLKERSAKIEALKSQLESIKSDVNFNEKSLESKTNTKISSADNRLQEDTSLLNSLQNILEELSDEVKSLQKSTEVCLQDNDSWDSGQVSSNLKHDVSSEEKTHGNQMLSDSDAADLLNSTGKSISENNDLNGAKTSLSLKEDSIQDSNRQGLSGNVDDSNKTSEMIQSYLRNVNERLATDSLDADTVETLSSLQDPLSNQVYKCVKHLYELKVGFRSLKSFSEKVEKDYNETLSRLRLLDAEKEKLSREGKAENKTLGEQLEKLRKENNLLTNKQESLKIEVNDLKKDKKEFENRVKSLTDLLKKSEDKIKSLEKDKREVDSRASSLAESLKKSEEECKSRQEALNIVNLNFIEEKNLLQEKIASLLSEVSSKDEILSSLRQDQGQLSDKLISLKQEKEALVAEKRSFEEKIKDLETKAESSKLTELQEELKTTKEDVTTISQNNQHLVNTIEKLEQYLENVLQEKSVSDGNLSQLHVALESSGKNNNSSSETIKKITNHLNMLTKKHKENIEENNNLVAKTNNIKRDLEIKDSELLSLSELNKTLSEDFKSLENTKKDLEEEINANKTKISLLEEELRQVADTKVSELQAKEKSVTTIMAEKESLLTQIKCLENELKISLDNLSSSNKTKDGISDENNSLKEKVRSLEEDLQKRQEEFASTMSEIMKTHEELSAEKSTIEKSCEILEADLKNKIEEISTLKSINEEISKEVISLKSTKDEGNKEVVEFQNKYKNVLAELQELRQNNNSVSESKKKLNDELTSLKEEYRNTLTVLDGMKSELQNQQQLCTELNQSLNDLTEAFQQKSTEIEEKCHENKRLKDDLKNTLEKFNETTLLLKRLTDEKRFVLDNLLDKLDEIKHLKQAQKKLLDLVNGFKNEISSELNSIQLLAKKDLPFLANNLVTENLRNSQLLVDLERKSKEEIDTYNCKIQTLQSEIKEANELLEDKNNLLNKRDSLEIDNDEQDSLSLKKVENFDDEGNLVQYQHLCKNLQSNLSQAFKLMKHLREMFSKSKYPGRQLNGVTHIDLNEETDLELKESWGSDKLLSEVDIFLNDQEKVLLCTNVNNFSKSSENKSNNTYLNDENHIPLELPFDRETVSNLDASQKLVDSQIHHLQQELKLKNDTIDRLQLTIEGFEKELLEKESVEELNKENRSKDEKLTVLEEENQVLMQKVLELQESHEIKVKNLIADFESKIEENTLVENETSNETKHAIIELREQIRNLQQDLEERGDAFEKLYIEHQQTVKERDEEVKQLRVNYDKEMREQDKKWRTCLDRRVGEEEHRHQAEVEELTSEWSRQRKELETASRLAVSVVESGSNSSEMLRRQVQALTVQLNQLQANRCEMCDTNKAFARERRKSNGSSRSIQDCTEMEYLRNILYEYMMGKEPLVLAKVLCALVKFDDTQTNEIVVKEQQKITLLGQLGLQ